MSRREAEKHFEREERNKVREVDTQKRHGEVKGEGELVLMYGRGGSRVPQC